MRNSSKSLKLARRGWGGGGGVPLSGGHQVAFRSTKQLLLAFLNSLTDLSGFVVIAFARENKAVNEAKRSGTTNTMLLHK